MGAKQVWRWLSVLVMLTIVVVGQLAPVAAQNTDVRLTVRPAFQGFFHPGTWLPVEVEVANEGVDRTAEIVVGPTGGPFFSTTLDLPGGSRKGVTVYVYIYNQASRIQAQLLVNGTEVATATAQVRSVGEGLLIGVVGTQQPRLPAQLENGSRITTVPLTLGDIPADGLGLSPFDALIFTDVAADELRSDQREAVRAWVLRGGTLVINGDSGLAHTLAILPDDVVPVTLDGFVSPLADPPLRPLRLIPRTFAVDQPFMVPLPKLPDGLAWGRLYGDGQSIVLGFDLATPELVNWSGWRALWQVLLPPSQFVPPNLVSIAKLYSTFLEENLASALMSLPAFDLPSLNLIVILLGCYVVVVGPVTYLVLRRFDRLALGWVVVPVVTLIFAVIAYSVGYTLRGGDVIISQLSLINTYTAPIVRERSFVGIFSPDRSTYRLRSTDDGVLTRPIGVQGPWSSEVLANGRYLQGISDTVVEGLEVPQWSLQAVATDRVITADVLEAQLVINGDEVQGEVVNRGVRTLEDVVVVYGDLISRLGSLAPGERRVSRLERPAYAYDGISLSYLIYGEQFDAMARMARPMPPDLQLKSRVLDALYGYGTAIRGKQPLVFGWYTTPETTIMPVDRRATRQQIALVHSMARLHLETGKAVTLDAGSFTGIFERITNTSSPCYSGNVLGAAPNVEPVVLRFMLPRDLIGLRPDSMTMNVRADMFWSGQIEVYDWVDGVWVLLPTEPVFQISSVEIPQPERVLGSHGVLRVRMQIRDQMQGVSCVYLDPTVQGRLP
ncbi:hypothetical protein [Chloroflexus aggregans]|uniref:Uncharacterized protein n=1 Tax=Chloroflexus aggregans (strain MD-66 / DSM 9485) TaxID=326427 RepID=B8G833_CHLAD|nr:hypothetical protein [Chloroflexus aggregans]ACL26087.1 conserved hypothetical protein [Chloroflexus aggregans DSM 9485]